jgi:hypothetical protein
MSRDTNSPIKMHDLSFLIQSERNFLVIHHCENYRLFSLVMSIRFNKQLSMSKILKRPDCTTPDSPEYCIYGPDV